MLMRPASLAVTKPTARSDVPSGSRTAGAVRMPMSWIRSEVISTGTSPGTPAAAGGGGVGAGAPAPTGTRGTSFILHLGQRAVGSVVTTSGSMGQVYSVAGEVVAAAGPAGVGVMTMTPPG